MIRFVQHTLFAFPLFTLLVHFSHFHGSSSLQITTATKAAAATPWCRARIDYSAANQFIQAHYGVASYFEKDSEIEDIWNARDGVMVVDGNDERTRHPANLPTCGFALLPQEIPDLVDWNDLNSIRETYLPKLRDSLLSVYGGSESIADILFWCPTLRTVNATPTPRETTNPATPRAGFVATAHIDTDVNAYESVQDFVDLLYKNQFPGTTTDYTSSELVAALSSQRRRFAIVNAWRNVGTDPIQQAPLAFMPSRYTQPNVAFPNGQPQSTHHWYTYPNMTSDELLLFCQYDRDASQPSDLWHCAIGVNKEEEHGKDYAALSPPRKSFDVRCFVLFRETVPKDRDRLQTTSQSTTTSRLNFKQSQVFCSQQAKARAAATHSE